LVLAGSVTKADADVGLCSIGTLGVGGSGAGGRAGASATVVASAAGVRDAAGLRAARVPSRRPYFSIQARSVFRVMRSATAVCEMFQRCCSRTPRRWLRMVIASMNFVPGPSAAAGAARIDDADGKASIAGVTSRASPRRATRSITLASCRTLPGHGNAVSCVRAAGEIVFGDSP
jgi:hypothetical protein